MWLSNLLEWAACLLKRLSQSKGQKACWPSTLEPVQNEGCGRHPQFRALVEGTFFFNLSSGTATRTPPRIKHFFKVGAKTKSHWLGHFLKKYPGHVIRMDLVIHPHLSIRPTLFVNTIRDLFRCAVESFYALQKNGSIWSGEARGGKRFCAFHPLISFLLYIGCI